MRRRRSLLVMLLMVLPLPAFAQRTTATIRGSVTDSSGAVVTGAKLTVRGEDTGYTRTTTTNASGLYTFAELAVGSYQVTAELSGFRSSVVRSIVLNVADTRAVDMQLSTGEVAELITVEANALQVKTIGGDVSGLAARASP